MSCSFTYVVAQIVGTGLIERALLACRSRWRCFVALGILVCSMLAAMRAVTWERRFAQYIVLIIAYLVPLVMLSAQKFGLPIPQLTYGQSSPRITAR